MYEAIIRTIEDEKIRALIHMLKYHNSAGLDNVARVLIWRLSNENLLIPELDFKLILTHATTDNYNGPQNYIILFGCYPQNEWLSVLITLQLLKNYQTDEIGNDDENSKIAEVEELDEKEQNEENHKITVADRVEIQCFLANVEDTQMLRLLSLKLSHVRQSGFSLKDVKAIFENSKNLEINNEVSAQLLDIGVGAWPLRLHWLDTILQIMSLSVTPEMDDIDLEELSYYTHEIRQKNSEDSCTTLLKIFSEKTDPIDKFSLKNALQKLYRNKWNLDDDFTLTTLKDNISSEWENKMSQHLKSDAPRDITQLLKLMNQDSSNWETVVSKIESKRNERISFDPSDQIPKDLLLKNVSDFNTTEIKQWLKFKSKTAEDKSPEDFLVETICVIDRAIKIRHGFNLRTTQILAIVIFLMSNNHGVLEQISTGEGKSLIIVTLAIYKALVEGKNVDIITSSVVLAERDAQENKALFKMFDLEVDHNNIDDILKRKRIYTNCHVIYGEISCFQRDLLLDTFYDIGNGIESRKVGCVIVDEVDSMLIDKGSNVLYLSHNIPGMDALEPLYVHMWKMAHAHGITGSDEDIEDIVLSTRHAMSAHLRKEELSERIPSFHGKTDQVWDDLVGLKVIDKNGKIQVDKISKVLYNKLNLTRIEIGNTMNLLKDCIRRGITVEIPNNLEKFVDLHLNEWAENALRARMMNVDEDYIIDIDQSDDARRTEPNIVIMDNSTGAEQYSSQWSNGLHQFLQLKHSCRVSLESLKAIFISNVRFFKRYGQNILGLSGTLGSQSERSFLEKIYQVEFYAIPTFKESQFVEYPPALFKRQDTWLSKLTAQCYKIVSNNQVVLVICETINQVSIIKEEFKKLENVNKMGCPLHVYTRSYEPVVGSEKELNEPCVILSTNLAGRGTDIKISEKISANGGLHVCVAYMPPNVRIEEQAFGRAARKGQKGSGQIFCFVEDENFLQDEGSSAEFVRLKTIRNDNEERHVNELHESYVSRTEPEENLLGKFREKYKMLKNKLSEKSTKREISDIVLNNNLDNWALWLDEYNTNKSKGSETSGINAFLSRINIQLRAPNFPEKLIDRSSHMIQYAILIDEARGLQTLEEVIQKDHYYRPVAQYYAAHLLVRLNNPKKSADCTECFQHLRASKLGFLKQTSSFQESIVAVAEISKSYMNKSPNFVLVNDYEAQKKDITGVAEVFVDSIWNVLGRELTPNAIADQIDPVQAKLFLNELQKTELVDMMHVSATDWSYFKEKYALYTQEIDSFLRSKKTETIDVTMLEEILPSREHFWSEMIDKNVLVENQNFIILNTEAAKNLLNGKHQPLLEKLEKTFIRSASHDLCTNITGEVFLYHEQLIDIQEKKFVPITEEEFGNLLGSIKDYKQLFDDDILCLNSRAVLSEEGSITTCKFGMVTIGTFLGIDGVDGRIAAEILKELEDKKIIGEIDEYKNQKVDWEELIRFELQCYPEFHSEVESHIEKDLRYKSSFLKLQKQREIQLPVMPHLELLQDLIDAGCIQPNLAKTDERSLKKVKEHAKNFVDKLILTQPKEQVVDSIVSGVKRTVSHLTKYNSPTSNLNDLILLFEGKMTTGLKSEIENFCNSGYTGVIVISLNQPVVRKLLMVLPLIIMAAAQIALGVAITLMTIGFGSLVGSNLIGEGFSDLLFAAECFWSGQFSWKAYAKHKAVSLMLSVLTLGVGAYLSRGAKESMYGYKIGGEAMNRLVGNELLEAVGTRVIAKTVAKDIGFKFLRTASQFVCWKASEMIAGTIEDHTRDAYQYCIEQACDFNEIKNRVHDLYVAKGYKLTQAVLEETLKKVFEKEENTIYAKTTLFAKTAQKYASQACAAYQKGSQHAVAKTGTDQSFGKVVRVGQLIFQGTSGAVKLLKVTTRVKAKSKEIESTLAELSSQAIQPSKDENSEIELTLDGTLEWFERKCSEFLAKDLSHEVGQEIIRPATELALNMAARQAYKKMKEINEKYQTKKHRLEFGKLKKRMGEKKEELTKKNKFRHWFSSEKKLNEKVNRLFRAEIYKLLAKTNDPDLYADMILADFPVGLIGLQAAARIAKTNLQIKSPDGKLILYVSDDTVRGITKITRATKFIVYDAKTEKYGTSNSSTSCLVEALQESKVKITKKEMVQALKTNPRLRECVKNGVESNLQEVFRRDSNEPVNGNKVIAKRNQECASCEKPPTGKIQMTS